MMMMMIIIMIAAATAKNGTTPYPVQDLNVE
jgi:hypothetical protein